MPMDGNICKDKDIYIFYIYANDMSNSLYSSNFDLKSPV